MVGVHAILATILIMNVRQSQEVTSCTMTSPCLLKGGFPFKQPRQLIAPESLFRVNMTVEVTQFKVEWFTVPRRCYNGEIPGPTWRIRPGVTIEMKLTNTLKGVPPGIDNGHNTFRFPNITNFHTHGLHVSGEIPHDNVFVEVAPDHSSKNYNYPILADHPPGTYWYHPHLHGSVKLQTESGMAGMIIVEDPTNSDTPQHIRDVSCPENCEHDIQLVFQPSLTYSPNRKNDSLFNLEQYKQDGSNDTLADWIEDNNDTFNYFTTNGLYNPVMDVKTGQTKRFRMVNAGGGDNLILLVTDSAGNAACDFYEIAIDGVYIDRSTKPNLGRSFLVPASRVDWLIVCNKEGTFYVKSLKLPEDEWSTGTAGSYNGTLLTLRVSGPTMSTVIKEDLPERPSYIGDFTETPQSEVQGRFVIEVGGSLTLNRDWFVGEEFWRYNVRKGTVQEWYFTNTATRASHPIHIHVNSFQVISYNAYTGPYDNRDRNNFKNWKLWNQNNESCFYQHENDNSKYNISPPDPLKYLGHEKRWKKGGPGTIGYSRPGIFRDVLLVPPLSNITIRFKADKFLGVVVIHCHILNHEDLGMMLTVKILPDGSDLSQNVSVPSGNAYPGTCDKGDVFPFNKAKSKANTINRRIAVFPIIQLLLWMALQDFYCMLDQ